MIVNMKTETTPIHNNMWHGDFLMLVVAGMLLSASAYMGLTIVPSFLSTCLPLSIVGAGNGISTAAYAVGLFALCPLCNWLVQHFKRGRVCMMAMAAYALCLLLSYFMFANNAYHYWAFIGLRFLTGAFYGLSAVVLLGTLVIDKSESHHRTRANHSAAWVFRFGLALGPLAAVVLARMMCAESVCLVSFGLVAAATLLVRIVKMPFKTPEDDIPLFSFDRFLMPGSWRLFLLTLVAFALYGYVFVQTTAAMFFAMLLVGFLWAQVTERYFPIGANTRRELIVSLIFVLMGAASYLSTGGYVYDLLAPCLLGAGLGMFGARSQLALIAHSQHCRRGTAVSTFLLASEAGVAIGMVAGELFLYS